MGPPNIGLDDDEEMLFHYAVRVRMNRERQEATRRQYYYPSSDDERPTPKKDENLTPVTIITSGYTPKPAVLENSIREAEKQISLADAKLILDAQKTNNHHPTTSQTVSPADQLKDDETLARFIQAQSIDDQQEPPSTFLKPTVVTVLDDNAVCSIYLEKYAHPREDHTKDWEYEKIARLQNCEHFFHSKCLMRWINENEMGGCPNCRTPFRLEPKSESRHD